MTVIGGTQKAKTTNTFDAYKRLTKKTAAIGSGSFVKNFSYGTTRVTKVADQVSGVNIGTNSYTFDDLGRIKSDNYTAQGMTEQYKRYTYDQYGQLVREDNQALAKTFVYAYNNNGNITSVQAYAYTTGTVSGTPVTTSFGYSADKLTSFGGTIAYNTMGCPTSYDGKTATWSKGRLSRLSRGSLADGTESYLYSYNAYGQRISKSYSYLEGTSGLNPVVSGQLTASSKQFYYDHAGRLIAETISKTFHGQGSVSENIVFLYDEGMIIGMEHTEGGTTSSYYFHRNPLGDVVGIYNTSGTLVAKYLYDAWGNCTIASGTTNYTVANANPIRYRGYYYDDDTGLYYCNARYYSPKWRRFISPDDTAYLDPESVNGLNLYCYCNNDPITLKKCATLPAGSATVFTTIASAAMPVANLHPSAINNPDIPVWIQTAVGAYSDVKLGMKYLHSTGMHARFAYATRTRFMFPEMGGTWCWFKRGSSRLANFGVIANGTFKQILTGNARAGFRAIANSVGKMAGVNFALNSAFNFYENDFQPSWDLLWDAAIDTAIGMASTLIASGAMSLVTAGVVAAGLSMPGIVVVGGVILLSIGIEYVIRGIFDYPD